MFDFELGSRFDPPTGFSMHQMKIQHSPVQPGSHHPIYNLMFRLMGRKSSLACAKDTGYSKGLLNQTKSSVAGVSSMLLSYDCVQLLPGTSLGFRDIGTVGTHLNFV